MYYNLLLKDIYKNIIKSINVFFNDLFVKIYKKNVVKHMHVQWLVLTNISFCEFKFALNFFFCKPMEGVVGIKLGLLSCI